MTEHARIVKEGGAPSICYGLRPFTEENSIVVCAGAHGVISPCGAVAERNGIVVCAGVHGVIPGKRKSVGGVRPWNEYC